MSDRELTPAPALPAFRGENVTIPIQIADTGEAATERFVEFFIATIRNENTRKTYLQAVKRFFALADQAGLAKLRAIRPFTSLPISKRIQA